MKQLSESARMRVNKNLLAEQVYDILFDLIVRDRLKPGDKLNIDGVSKQLNVSRSPVAAAFSALERDGFLVILPQNGSFVRELTRAELDAVYMTRAALEQVVAAFAVGKAATEDLLAYKKDFESFRVAKNLSEDDMFALLEVETRLHNYLAGFLPDIVRREYRNICNLTRRSRLLNLKHELIHSDISEMIANNVDIHNQIIDAFVAKKQGLCARLLKKDVLYTRDNVLSELE